ncbi:hypothetical protein ACT29H_14000 [Thermophagus sp. OGC60D27]|uniref:hypothetical protein n=1 Tax=Thermophagus sp. OGC60D27 TaxID=3458415 RepID=UPI0040378627
MKGYFRQLLKLFGPNRPIRCLTIFLFWFLFSWPSIFYAQISDTITIFRNDTIIRLITPKTINKTTTNEGRKLEEILKNQSEKNFFSRKLHEWLVKSSLDSIKDTIRQPSYFQHIGKKIACIHIRSIPPFGASINDTSSVSDSWLIKMGNKLRFETAPGIVLKTLTFQPGETLKKTDITDSERLLRALSFINDTRIVAWTSSGDNNTVNISVYVQDRYPLAVSLGLKKQQPSFTLINKNLFGRGIYLSNTIVTPTAEIRDWGFRERFGAENFPGQYFNFDIDYAKMNNFQVVSGNIEKNFVLPEIKYAGGATINRSYINPGLKDYPSLEWDPALDYRRQNFWAGRSFLLGTSTLPIRSNFYIMTRYLDLKLYNQVENQEFLPEGKFYFGGVSFSRRGYYKNNLIYSFGRTEDVPFGSLTSFNYGFQNGNESNRHYLEFHHSRGQALIPSKGYVYVSGDIGSYFKAGKPEQGHIKLMAEYISPLINLNTSQFRHFMEIQYVNGFKRLPGEFLFIDEDEEGLRRFDFNQAIKGSEKLVFKTEQVFFTNIEPWGFKFVAFTFFDTAFLKESDKQLFRHSPYFSFGGGLRIRNDNMVFNTLQIMLAIMPRVPSGELPFSFRISGESSRDFKSFVPDQPGSSTYY